MKHINIKALSTNDMHIGRHFPTPELKQYKIDMARLLPKSMKIPEGKLHVNYSFGVSSKNCDWDNLIKATQDCISSKYGFNDRMIYTAFTKKIDVQKGEEFLEFEILPLEES